MHNSSYYSHSPRRDLGRGVYSVRVVRFVAALLYLLAQPAHPVLLVVHGRREQQQFFGITRIIMQLARRHVLLLAPFQMLLVHLYPTPCKKVKKKVEGKIYLELWNYFCIQGLAAGGTCATWAWGRFRRWWACGRRCWGTRGLCA